MLERSNTDLQMIYDFLRIKTPEDWLKQAKHNMSLLLIDHAHCERKAAATAIHFISKYPHLHDLVDMMSHLAREELLHFKKVIDLLKQRNIPFGALHPCDYASSLHHQVTQKDGMERLSEQLIIGAIIEARSCERFNAIIPILDDLALSKFYRRLIKSEARHFKNYLKLASQYGGNIDNKLNYFLDLENKFILSNGAVFRFHSGVPPQ